LRLPATLTELRLPRCTVPASLLAALQQLPALKQLDLEKVALGSEHVNAIATLRHLEALKISESCLAVAVLDAVRAALPQARVRLLP
jgi:hypothetical protein